MVRDPSAVIPTPSAQREGGGSCCSLVTHPAPRNRPYDLVLYGAGGFTGRQTVAYLAQHAQAAGLRWAIAGRHRQRLEAARAAAGPGARDAEIILADSADQASVDAMVSRAHVVAKGFRPRDG